MRTKGKPVNGAEIFTKLIEDCDRLIMHVKNMFVTGNAVINVTGNTLYYVSDKVTMVGTFEKR